MDDLLEETEKLESQVPMRRAWEDPDWNPTNGALAGSQNAQFSVHRGLTVRERLSVEENEKRELAERAERRKTVDCISGLFNPPTPATPSEQAPAQATQSREAAAVVEEALGATSGARPVYHSEADAIVAEAMGAAVTPDQVKTRSMTAADIVAAAIDN